MMTRTLAILTAVMLASAGTAHADVGVGLFVGEPVGLDLDIGLARRSSLDIVLGWTQIPDGRDHYAHLTYLLTPVVGRGSSVLIPLRIGLGAAIYDDGRFDNGINAAVRVPLEVALRFRRAPLEIYGEISLLVTFLDANNNNDTFDVDGGLGLRFYF